MVAIKVADKVVRAAIGQALKAVLLIVLAGRGLSLPLERMYLWLKTSLRNQPKSSHLHSRFPRT